MKPQPERLLTLVMYHNRVVTEGLRPSEGNCISQALSETKFISSCNELKTSYCHHSNTLSVGAKTHLLHPTSSMLLTNPRTLILLLCAGHSDSTVSAWHRSTQQHMEDTNTVNAGSPTHLWKIRCES